MQTPLTSVQASDSVRSAIASRVTASQDTLIQLSHRIHSTPEIAWEEYQSSAWVAQCMSDAGFDVTTNYLDVETAVSATKGTGPLHLVVCAEYDALPGLGHACGHNIIAASSVGAAIAIGEVADELGIKVTLMGTPAEEGEGGKLILLERGAFKGVHAAVMSHPGPVDVAQARPYAVTHLDVRYHGKAAHAAAYPEDGINAGDAFTIAQVAIGLLRQQLSSEVRVHGLVTKAGDAPNVIPEFTEGRWYVRGTTSAQMDEAFERVRRCFEAGALATGATLELGPSGAPYVEFRTDHDLLAKYVRNAEELGRVFSDGNVGLGRMSRASTDMGNVSQVVPAIHPYIGIDSAPAVNHQHQFAAAAITGAADRAVLDAATGLALTLADAATDPHTRERLLHPDPSSEKT
jgi:amidohydrolase